MKRIRTLTCALRKSRGLALLLALSLLLTAAGCSGSAAGSLLSGGSSPAEVPEAVRAIAAKYQTGSPLSAAQTTIQLSEDSTAVTGAGAQVSGSTVTITAGGVYAVSGTLDDGQLVINAAGETVELLLNGVSISSDSSAPIYAKKAALTVITLIEGTENTLSEGSGAAYETTAEEEPNGCLFSKNDLVICGSGALSVSGAFRHGISTKDNLILTSGTVSVTAADNGLHGHDGVYVTGGTISVTAAADGIKSNNDAAGKGWIEIAGGTLEITAGDDGIQAESSLCLSGGEIQITAAGGSANAAPHTTQDFGGQKPGGQRPDGTTGATGTPGTPPDGTTGTPGTPPDSTADATGTDDGTQSSAGDDTDTADTDTSGKACKAGGALAITGGTLTADAADDCVHSNGDITISGGTLTLASGDDGVHADGALTISDGSITVSTSYEGLEGGTILISGGSMAVTASDDGLNATGTGSGNAMQGDSSAQLTISGGTLQINAGGDGIDSNGSLTFTGGITLVDGPTNSGNGALDYGTDCTISGGVLLAASSAGMATAPGSASTQNSILVTLTAQQAAGTPVSLVAEDGTCLLTYVPQKQYQSMVFSCSALKSGETYSIVVGGTPAEDNDLHYSTAGITGGTADATATLSDVTTTVGSGSGFGGGFGGGQRPDGGKFHGGQQSDSSGGTTQPPTDSSGSGTSGDLSSADGSGL